MKDLMAENHVLRGLIRSLSGFIGDGAGGLLPKLGWTMRDFEAYVNRSETDTAYESFQRRKNDNGNSRKRSADDGGSADGANKRARGGSDRPPDGFPALMPVNPMGPGGMFPPPPPSNTGRSPAANGNGNATLFSDLMRSAAGGSSPMFTMAGASPTNGGSPFGSGPSPSAYDTSYMGNMSMGGDGSLSFGQGAAAPAPPVEEEEERQDPKNEEAQKLISYHLDNYKRNSQYCLPASLRPTLVQRTVPHGKC